MKRLTGLFLDAGASYEAGMPLVWELTAEIKNWLTPPKIQELKLELGAGLGRAKLGEGADWSPKLRETISRLIDGLDDVIGPGFLVHRAGCAL